MDRSSMLGINEEIYDVCDFLINNESVIISDLKKEFEKRIKSGRALHQGFKRQAFEEHMKESLKQRIKEIYTYEKRYYMTSETAMIITCANDVVNLVNEIVNKVMED